MPILHMETELVRGVGNQLQQASTFLQEQTQQLNQSAQNLANAWRGPSADIFISELQPLLQQAHQLANSGNTLNQRLQREVDEWERIGQGINPVANRFGSGGPDNTYNNQGAVLGATDVEGDSGNKATIVEWFQGIYETLEMFISKVAPGARLTEWMGGAGTLFKGVDLITSTHEVTENGSIWQQTMAQYGADAPETLAARYEYSDAECSQIIPAPVKLILKQFGAWDELVRSFEGAKYEGTHNLFDPPKVQ